MPQDYSSPPAGKRSALSPSMPPEGASSEVFTADPPDSTPPAGNPSQPVGRLARGTPLPLGEGFPSSEGFPLSEGLSATEPFPDGLFRVPVPDYIFSEMPEMSDSALRALLGLIHLSFRFEPEKAAWVKPERSFTRSEIEAECGLSGQGTRNGLKELAEAGYISSNKAGRSYEHTLEIEVPTSRYTYVPTALMEATSGLGGTELHLVLAVIRATWGWTAETESGGGPPNHRRWAQLSTSELARRTGRSETAIKEAASRLQGCLLGRLRPSGGAYYYRLLPEAIGPQKDAEEASEGTDEDTDRSQAKPSAVRLRRKRQASFSMGIANDLAPDRQKSDPPSVKEEEFERVSTRETKQSNRKENSVSERTRRAQNGQEDAVRRENSPSVRKEENRSRRRRHRSKGSSPRPSPSRRGRSTFARKNAENPHEESSSRTDLSGFSKRLQSLGEALINVGVNAGQVPYLLNRFSAERIEVNFELYRKQAPSVQRPGAWLYAAITEGFVLPSPSTREGNGSKDDSATGSVPEPGTKVSETRKRELIRQDRATEEDFDKFKDFDEPDRKQHFFRLE